MMTFEKSRRERYKVRDDVAERVGFEPTVRVTLHNGFRDRHHRPLGHLSIESH